MLRAARLAGCASAAGGRCLSSAPPRPFRVLGLQQIAVGGGDKRALAALWCGLLGLPKVGEFRSSRENVDEDILRLGGSAAEPRADRLLRLLSVEVDIMQPVDAAKSPRVAEPPLNHVGLWVDALPAAVAWLTAAGVRFAPGGVRRGAGGHDVAFIHPRPAPGAPLCGEGVLIELVQAPADVIDAFNGKA
jgi:lactoylglutathione lyase